MSTHDDSLAVSDLQLGVGALVGSRLQRLQAGAIVAAIAGLVLLAVGYFAHRSGFWHSYLVGLMFWVGASTGSLALLMMHHTTGGGWGYILRRFFEAATQLIPWMLLFCIPLFIGVYFFGQPFVWARPEQITDPVIRGKFVYLNSGFFIIRTILYFAVWSWFGWRMRSSAAVLEQRYDRKAEWRLNVLGGFGMVVYVVLTTFIGIDWVMSLTPRWYSSIFGFILVVSQALTSICLMTILVSRLAGDQPLVMRRENQRYFRDIGNLTLALIILWAYMSFSQYLLQFTGNLLDEIAWYLPRRAPGWGWYSIIAIPLHFFLPFIILLVGSDIKKNPNRLAVYAAGILIFRILDIYWWVSPTFYANCLPSWADIGSLLFIGGFWLWGWAAYVGRARSLVPAHDPRMELLAQEAAQHA